MTETIYVDWLFAKQGVPVLATLTDLASLASLVTTAANDIRQVAGL